MFFKSVTARWINKSDQLDELKDVWKGWLLSLDKKLIDSSQIEKVVKVR